MILGELKDQIKNELAEVLKEELRNREELVNQQYPYFRSMFVLSKSSEWIKNEKLYKSIIIRFSTFRTCFSHLKQRLTYFENHKKVKIYKPSHL